MSHKIQCSECTSAFSQKKNLYAHLRKFHEIEPIFSRKSLETFKCNDCSKHFSCKSTLARHSRSHKTDVDDISQSVSRQSRLLCPWETNDECCDRRFVNYAKMRHHLLDKHNVDVEVETLEFNSFESFQMWKSTIEQQNLSLYTRDSSPKQLSTNPFGKFNINKVYYNCHRSHCFKPTGSGIRRPKSTGSNKIGKACPSRMEVSILQSEAHLASVKVKFWKTHCGHELQLGRICLDTRTRAEIAEKLERGESFDQILNSFKDPDKRQQDRNPRLSLLKRKDLHNIVRDFKIDYRAKQLFDACPGEDLWVNNKRAESDFEKEIEDDKDLLIECQENGVLETPSNKSILENNVDLSKNINNCATIEQPLENIIIILNNENVVVQTIEIFNTREEH